MASPSRYKSNLRDTVRAADVDVFAIGKPDRCELYGSVSGATTT